MPSCSTQVECRRSGSAHRWGLALSLLVSLAIVAYLALQLQWGEFWSQLKRMHPGYLPPLILILLASMWIRAMRWRLLLPTERKLSVLKLTEATVVGFLASFVLPLRAGELVRPWALSRVQPVPFSTALASIVTERFFDALTLLSLLVACALHVPNIPGYVLAGARTVGLLVLVLLILLVVCYLRPALVSRLLRAFATRVFGRRAPRLAERVVVLGDEFVQGLRALSSPLQLAAVLGWSFALWLLVAGWYQLALWSFGERPSLWVGMTVNVMVALAVAAPSAPGFIGTFQAGCLLALSVIFAYSQEFAIAYSVITHVLQTALVLGAGFAVLQAWGLRLSSLRRTGPAAERLEGT